MRNLKLPNRVMWSQGYNFRMYSEAPLKFQTDKIKDLKFQEKQPSQPGIPSPTPALNQFTKGVENVPNPQALSHYYKTKIEKKSTLTEKIKHIWRHMVHSLKEVKSDAKYAFAVRQNKGLKINFSPIEFVKYNQIMVDLIKFLPYSVFIIVPGAELVLPIYMWLLPNSTPS